MAETLTESFCERCGTRYEFKAPTRLNPLRKTRGLIGGLRNYVMSQDALGDAVGDAMRSEEDRLAAAQLEAFHESFNFCISCRQYTCLNCWNDTEGRCRSCAPVAGTDDLAERIAASLNGGATAIAEPAPPAAEPELPAVEAWPTSDLPEPATNGDIAPTGWPGDGFVYDHGADLPSQPTRAPDGFVYETPHVTDFPALEDLEPAATPSDLEQAAVDFEPQPEPAAAELEPEPVMAEIDAPAAPIELEPAAAETEPAPVAAEVEPEPPLLRVVAWDQDGAYDLEPEPIAAQADIEPEPEPVVAEVPEAEPVVAEVEPEPVVAEVEPEPVVAEVEPEPVVAEVEPEPVVAEVEPELTPEPGPEPGRPTPIAPISETILRFPQRPTTPPAEAEPVAAEAEPVAAEADSPELAARRAQLDLLGLGDPGQGPVQQAPTVVPYRSRGAAVTQGELAARAAAATGASFWEASAREVAGAAGTVGVQNCGQCGLSLSASARFCRRCGTRQAQSA